MTVVRLYVDEDASESAVVAGLRARGVDLVTTVEANRCGASDVVIPEQRYSIGQKVRRLAAFVQASSVESMANRIEFL